MPRNRIIQLRPDNTATQSRGFYKSDDPDVIYGRQKFREHSHTIWQDPDIPNSKPIRFDSWDDWAANPPPAVHAPPDAARTILAPANDHFPISYMPEWTLSEKNAYGESHLQKSWQEDWARARREDSNSDVQRIGMIGLSASLVILVVLFILLASGRVDFFLNRDIPKEQAAASVQGDADLRTPNDTSGIREISPGVCVTYVPAIQDFTMVDCPTGDANGNPPSP